MGSLGQDLRFAARSLVKSPGFTLVVVLTLGLGIGANTAIITILDGLYQRMIPYEEPEHLVTPAESFGDGVLNITSIDRIEQWRERSVTCEEITGMRSAQLTLKEPGGSERGRARCGR